MKEPGYLFNLSDGTRIFRGDILSHPDHRNVGWYCTAEFKPKGDFVTVRSPNGAVPTVKISTLKREPPHLKWCKLCGQRIT